MTERKSPDSWRKKVHPAYLEVARIYGDSLRILRDSRPNDTSRNAQRVRTRISKAREELLTRYPELRPGSSWNHATAASIRFLSQRDIALGILEWLCWRRFGQPLAVLLAEEKAGTLEAHERVLRIRNEFWRLQHGHGPIAPFKGNSDHSDLMELGMSLGLDALTEDELAACFNEVCICGKDHDADALKKQRARVRKKLEAARLSSLRVKSPRQRFAAFGAHGLTAKPYQWTEKGIRCVEVSQSGKRPECVVYEDGPVFAPSECPFFKPDGVHSLLAAFGVESFVQLFAMFFPVENEA